MSKRENYACQSGCQQPSSQRTKKPGASRSRHFYFTGFGAGQTLQIATVAVFGVCVIAGVLFWRDLPDFKISMQAFMQAQKHWKCRDCNHQWQN